MVAPSAIRTGGKSMCGSAWASAPPTVATLRTRTFDSRRMVRTITGAPRATAGECSSALSGAIAPMVRSPADAAAMWVNASPSLRKLTRRLGRKTPAFIISISAVPPAIGRTSGSSGSISAMASLSESGSSSSKAIMVAFRSARRRRQRLTVWKTAFPFPWPSP